MTVIESLRSLIPFEEFDYQALLAALHNYAHPRDKISDLIAKNVIIRVKKGLYIFADSYRRSPYSREILANLIYGPSCLSLEYALHYHGLLPERSAALTSVTTKRPKKFKTPVGLFLYKNIPEAGFHVGLQRFEMERGRAFLMAGPEKALADKLRSDRGLNIRSQKECVSYLVDSLRIEMSNLTSLDTDLLAKIAEAYGSKRVRLLSGAVRRLQKREP